MSKAGYFRIVLIANLCAKSVPVEALKEVPSAGVPTRHPPIAQGRRMGTGGTYGGTQN